ncbi:ATP-binding protein [Pedobacter sp. SYSU D00535]|uniref:ATP-binding protein n=1 Tax=Pedobacter sp. SYSU D00535 TaxID=2810308 RepID=UPI001A96F159|nr:ATP-binding protein [Pedobacter sp. SYSU D00535]
MIEVNSEEKAFVDCLPIGACVLTGPDHIVVAANAQMLALLGAQAIISKTPISDLVCSESRSALTQQLNQLYQLSDIESRLETQLSIKDSESGYRYLNVCFKPRFNSQGEIYGVLTTATDVTEYVLGQEKLRKAENKQAFLLKLSDRLRKLSNPGEIQKEAARILGEHLKASRVGYGDVDQKEQRWFKTEHNWTDGTVPPHLGVHDLSGFGADVLEALRTGVNLVIDDMLTDPRTASPEMQAAFTALQFRSVLTVSLLKESRFVAAMYVHDRNPRNWTEDEIYLTREAAERTWDAVQRSIAEETLRLSENKFRTLFDNIDQGFCILEVLYDEQNQPADLLYLLINHVFERQTGMTAATGKTFRSLVNSGEQFWIDQYSKVAETGKPLRFERYSKSLDRWFSVYASRMEGGAPNQVAVIFDDITERKLQDQRKNDFISMVSHELKTPLTSVKALLQLSDRKLAQFGDTVTENLISKSLLQVTKMEKLIQGFLDVSRLENGKVHLNETQFELSGLIKEHLDDFSLLSNSHKLIFSPCPPLLIKADRDKLGQVIHNFLSNAIKYSPKESQVEVTCKEAGKWVEVRVNDQGIGIKPEYIDKLFDRFFRVNDSSIRHISGFGIGLYLCSEIVKYHKGEIGVDSVEGEGSSFWFRLPHTQR